MSDRIWGMPGLDVVRCDRCGFYAADLETWRYPYSDTDYYTQIVPSLINPEFPYVQHRIKGILRRVTAGRAADLGCGLGSTVLALCRAGFEAHGVEESPNAVNYLKSHWPQVYWHQDTIERFLRSSPSYYDVITMYHVLEHIPNPKLIGELVYSALRPGGTLVVEVPDVQGGQARWKRRRWHHWAPHHVNYFTEDTLSRLLTPVGFAQSGSERKYHLNYPQGILWKDAIHDFFASLGAHDIITTYWTKPA